MSFGQNRDSRIDSYLGLSKNTIQKIWGYPEYTEINSDGYLLWHYSYNHAERIFYFYDNYVEMSQSLLMVNSYEYAKQLAEAMDSAFESEGFWLISQQANRFLYTNGISNILVQITQYNNNYLFQLLAYK